jgi:phosphoribosyl-AMP cyclohydrolase
MYAPDFKKTGGLVPAIVQDDQSGEVLMLAYMNQDAWLATLSTGKATYYSRSRQKLWVKGETSGNFQLVKEIRIDCDNDTVLLKIRQLGGAACHTGYRSCFHKIVENGSVKVVDKPVFDPKEVYTK